MILLELKPRLLESKDWATVLIVVCLLLIVVAKTSFENRFNDFIRLLVSDKYLKIYRDSSHLMTGFNVILFIVNLVSVSFLLLLFFDHFGYGKKTDWVLFVQNFCFNSCFYPFKIFNRKNYWRCFLTLKKQLSSLIYRKLTIEPILDCYYYHLQQ